VKKDVENYLKNEPLKVIIVIFSIIDHKLQ